MSHAFDPRRGLVVVHAEIFGLTGSAVLRLALDTGATQTLINSNALVALGYDPAAASERIQVTTGSGIESSARIVIQKIMALGLVLKIDFRKGRITLT